ncbi:hypothetical protein ACXR2T_10740 [Leucobacter sp. HY1910]
MADWQPSQRAMYAAAHTDTIDLIATRRALMARDLTGMCEADRTNHRRDMDDVCAAIAEHVVREEE